MLTHNGSEGQGFELAVCDALNAGVPDLCDAVTEGLADVGVRMRTPRAIVMGLEKVTDPLALASAVTAAVGDRRLLTGQRGRPASAARAVEALLAGGTSITANRGSLAAADLLVYDGDGEYTVTASVKITPSGWGVGRDVNLPRLWISTGVRSYLRSRLPPNCAVACVGDRTLDLYRWAHGDVVEALTRVNVGHMVRARRTPVFEVLQRRRNEPVLAALEELRERAAMVFDGYGVPMPQMLTPQDGVIHIEALDLPPEFEQYDQTQSPGGLRVLTNRRLTDLVTPHEQFFTRRAA